jgi:hypothetical protein
MKKLDGSEWSAARPGRFNLDRRPERRRYECIKYTKTRLKSVALVRKRTIPTERPPPVGEVTATCHVVSVTDPYGIILGFLDRV